MITYIGTVQDGLKVVVEEDGGKKDLPLRLDLANHSPTGFSWGYGGSGPSQLSLAILAYQTSDQEALKYYQYFKWDKIALIPQNQDWVITDTMVIDFLARHRQLIGPWI